MHRSLTLLVAGLFAGAASPAMAQERQGVLVVGSSTITPFVEVVIDHLARASGITGIKESTGTGAGLRRFCEGVGPATPDVAGASRPISAEERRLCERNGVRQITEIRFGLDGIVLAAAKGGAPLTLSRRQIFDALAREVEKDGRIVANPNTSWAQVGDGLPDLPIDVLGPPTTSGTRDAFAVLAMLPGCMTSPVIAALPGARRAEVCDGLRDDGRYVESGEDDELLAEALVTQPGKVGIFGFSFYETDRERLAAATVDGMAPTVETIADGSYPLGRPLFLYVKNENVKLVPELRAFVDEFTAEATIGDEGYLIDEGLVPLPADGREAARQAASTLAPLVR